MITQRGKNARLQSEFYRDKFRKTLKWLLVTMILTFALLATVIYLVFIIPPRVYFANTTDGHIMPMPSPITK